MIFVNIKIEKHASNYIAMMAEENNYSESPYVVSRTALLAKQKLEQINSTQSIHNSFQQQYNTKQQQNGHSQQQLQYPSQQQQQFNTNQSQSSNNNGSLHQLQQQQSLDSSISNGSNQIDKENRHFSTSFISSSTTTTTNTSQSTTNNLNDFNRQQHLGNNFPSSAKSNAIFDRFDIMNSEKQHRFKVKSFNIIILFNRIHFLCFFLF